MAREANNVAATSQPILSRLYRQIDWEPGTRNLDLGSGRYDLATEHLARHGVENLRLDPFNRTLEQNRQTLRSVRAEPVDTVTLANVLHVIEDDRRRRRLLWRARRYLRPGGIVYISVMYTGSRLYKGRKRRGTWLAERPLTYFLPEIMAVFPRPFVAPRYIWAVNEDWGEE